MAIRPLPGAFYEFHRARVTSRPGQPIESKVGFEISPQISREVAAQQVSMGKDVYTFLKSDAERLAARLYPSRPVCEAAHQPTHYPHFHPGGVHGTFDREREGRPRAATGPGHVFFGERGGG